MLSNFMYLVLILKNLRAIAAGGAPASQATSLLRLYL